MKSNPKTTRQPALRPTLAVGILGMAALAMPVPAAQVVYESFDYSAGQTLNADLGPGNGTLNGGNGWENAWTADEDKADATHNFAVVSPGLTFPDLPTAGNATRRSPGTGNRGIAFRFLSAASVSTLMSDNSTMWFSVLYQDTGGGDDFAFLVGNENHDFPAGGGPDPGFNDPGDAFGFASIGGGINASKHDDSTRQTLSTGTLAATGGTFLLTGKINWNPNGTADELFLFNITDPTAAEPVEGDAFASLTGDFDQSTFDRVSMWDRPASAGTLDEIRLATSFEGAMGLSLVIPEPFALTITPATAPTTGYDLEWESQEGKLYNLRTSPDLAGEISAWTLVEGDIAATPPTNTSNVDPADPRRFYAVEEFDAPPPPPLFEENFEGDEGEGSDGGFAVATVEGTAWERGTPDSSGLGGTIDSGNDGSANAWATNLGTVSSAGGSPTAVESGFFADPTDTALRSPVIDLTGVTGAELTFAEALDFPDTDSAVVNLINATTDEVIAEIHTSEDGDVSNAPWSGVGPIDLAAGVGQQVRLEWRFEGAGGTNDDFMGWYIDDVVITETTP